MNSKKVFERADGLAKVEVYASSGGRFSFCEEAWRENENGSGELYSYWLPVYEGGLYASFEEAEADACATISWLREEPNSQIEEWSCRPGGGYA
jgi:hypothetical protein